MAVIAYQPHLLYTSMEIFISAEVENVNNFLQITTADKDASPVVECVPNFSEGKNPKTVESIADCYRGKTGVKLLDYTMDADHNRSVITAIGKPEALARAVFDSIKKASELIDLSKHTGGHPRIGAADVIPFIPLHNMEMIDAVSLARSLGKRVGNELGIPVFLYEEAVESENRKNLAAVRCGGFEGLEAKMRLTEWQPDFGPAQPHPTAGACAIGARVPLCAFNINLYTDDLNIAKEIARKIRFSSGGMKCCKAIGVMLKSRNQAQVSMNLTDYTQTAIWQAFEAVQTEAAHYNIGIASSELIGLAPAKALLDCAEHYLKLENFSVNKILDFHI